MTFGEMKEKGNDTHVREMNEAIETETKSGIFPDLEGNSPSSAEETSWFNRLHKLLTYPFAMNIVCSPSEPSSGVDKVSRK